MFTSKYRDAAESRQSRQSNGGNNLCTWRRTNPAVSFVRNAESLLQYLYLRAAVDCISLRPAKLPFAALLGVTFASREYVFGHSGSRPGHAMAETIALHVNVIHNEELTGHLRDLGNRLVQHLPPTHLNFRFYL